MPSIFSFGKKNAKNNNNPIVPSNIEATCITIKEIKSSSDLKKQNLSQTPIFKNDTSIKIYSPKVSNLENLQPNITETQPVKHKTKPRKKSDEPNIEIFHDANTDKESPENSENAASNEDSLVKSMQVLSLEKSPPNTLTKSILKQPQKLTKKYKEKKISFNCQVMVSETFSREEYKRRGEFIARMLTPDVAYLIKNELNLFKSEMDVHEDAREFTQYYYM